MTLEIWSFIAEENVNSLLNQMIYRLVSKYAHFVKNISKIHLHRFSSLLYLESFLRYAFKVLLENMWQFSTTSFFMTFTAWQVNKFVYKSKRTSYNPVLDNICFYTRLAYPKAVSEVRLTKLIISLLEEDDSEDGPTDAEIIMNLFTWRSLHSCMTSLKDKIHFRK